MNYIHCIQSSRTELSTLDMIQLFHKYDWRFGGSGG